MDLYADPFLFEDLLLGQQITDKEELRRAFKAFENTDPPGPAGTHEFAVLRYTGYSQHGVIEWEWRGQPVGEFLGVPAAGKEMIVRGMTLHTYENSKIVREATFWDAVTALQQLGALKPTVNFWKAAEKTPEEWARIARHVNSARRGEREGTRACTFVIARTRPSPRSKTPFGIPRRCVGCDGFRPHPDKIGIPRIRSPIDDDVGRDAWEFNWRVL